MRVRQRLLFPILGKSLSKISAYNNLMIILNVRMFQQQKANFKSQYKKNFCKYSTDSMKSLFG